MKTTSYKISKQLQEIGFKAENNFYWEVRISGVTEPEIVKDGYNFPVDYRYPAYDLETILEALPYYQILKNFLIDQKTMSIGNAIVYQGDDFNCLVKQENKESLADCAAKLLIKLVEEEIINFKK